MALVEEVKGTVVQGHTFTISPRYNLQESRLLGKGSYGVVVTAIDSVRGCKIAIKRIRPYANDEWDARHTLREIRLLKLLGAHPNIITLYSLSLFDEKTELYMYMELMDCDLHHIIQSKQPLTDMHYKCFTKQMLEGIKAMHSIGVFHRDLKPGNILVSKDCRLRITDFGLARFMSESTLKGDNCANPMTEYVVTRWYRCPELLLAQNRPYSDSIDLWSIGCILAELIKRKPLFPGKSHANQVQLIFEVLGFDNPKELGYPLPEEATSFLMKRCRYPKQSLSLIIPDATTDALELIEALLAVNPFIRPSAADALEFKYLIGAEELCDYSINYLSKPNTNLFDFEMAKFSVQDLKHSIHEEVLQCKLSDAQYVAHNKITLSGASRGNINDLEMKRPTNIPTKADAYVRERRNSYSESQEPASEIETQPKGAKMSRLGNSNSKQQIVSNKDVFPSQFRSDEAITRVESEVDAKDQLIQGHANMIQNIKSTDKSKQSKQGSNKFASSNKDSDKNALTPATQTSQGISAIKMNDGERRLIQRSAPMNAIPSQGLLSGNVSVTNYPSTSQHKSIKASSAYQQMRETINNAKANEGTAMKNNSTMIGSIMSSLNPCRTLSAKPKSSIESEQARTNEIVRTRQVASAPMGLKRSSNNAPL